MSNGMDALDELAKAGFFMTCAASTVIPVGWACAGEMFVMLGDPGQLLDASLAWFDAAGKIGDALNANMDLTNSLGSAWEGADAEAFAAKAADLTRQMMMAMSFAYVVGVALLVAALALMVAALVIFAMGVGFAIFATAIGVAAATGVGFLGPVEALMIQAEMYGLQCEYGLQMLDKTVLIPLFNTLAAAIGAALAANVGMQIVFGNDEAVEDLVQATLVGIPTMASGIVAAVFTRHIGNAMKPPFGTDIIRALGIGLTGLGGDPIGDLTERIDPSRWD